MAAALNPHSDLKVNKLKNDLRKRAVDFVKTYVKIVANILVKNGCLPVLRTKFLRVRPRIVPCRCSASSEQRCSLRVIPVKARDSSPSRLVSTCRSASYALTLQPEPLCVRVRLLCSVHF